MLKVEIADTPGKQEQGLMFRKELNEDSGMLFKFSQPSVLKFWNLNTFIPLDIAFVDGSGKIAKIARIDPIDISGLRTISSETDCLMAIEANMGYFASNGIKIGNKIKLAKNDEIDVIDFEE